MIGSLHLAYFAAEVTLHRAILRFSSPNTDPQLLSITCTAAKQRFLSAIDLVNKLEPAHLQSFWYFASRVNLAIIGTFGCLLWALSDTPEEAEFCRSQLAEYRWKLRVSSKGTEFMKFTVGMLDASAVFLRDGTPKDSKVGMPKNQNQPQQISPRPIEKKQQHSPPNSQFDQTMDDSKPAINYMTLDSVSPSVGGTSSVTENAYPNEVYNYETQNNPTLATDIRPIWSEFSANMNFTAGDIGVCFVHPPLHPDFS